MSPRRLATAALAPLALVSLGVALWLAVVVLTVLPARDPAHVPLWSAVAVAFAAHAALSLAALARRSRPLAIAATGLSMLALVAGACGLVLAVRADAAHFEGYAIVMSVVLLAHGAAGMLREGAAA